MALFNSLFRTQLLEALENMKASGAGADGATTSGAGAGGGTTSGATANKDT